MTLPPTRYFYGQDKLNYADLHRPTGDGAGTGAARGTVVLIHGGFWRWSPDYFDGPTPLARAFAAEGFAVWQLEYRTVGAGGGWPTTFVDVDAGIAHLAVVAEDEGIELGHVVTVGHSAGGHLAVWALGVENSPLVGAVSLAGVLDLRLAERENLGRGAVANFLGGSSARHPERIDSASPTEHPILGKGVRLVHGDADPTVPDSQSRSYLAAALAAGQDAALSGFPGDHFDVIDPTHDSWKLTLGAVVELTA